MKKTTIFILLILLLSFTKNLMGQSWTEDFDKFKTNLKSEKYNEAYIHLQNAKLKFLSTSNFDTTGRVYTDLLFHFGKLFFELESYDSSIFYFKKCYEKQEVHYDKNSVEIFSCLNYLALCNYRKKDFSTALTAFKDLIPTAIKIYTSKSSQVAILYANIANSFNKLAVFDSSKYYYENALSIKKEVYGLNSNEYLLTLTQLNGLLVSSGKCKEAIPLCIQAINIRKQISGTLNFSYLNNLLRLADCYKETQDFVNTKALLIEFVETFDSKKDSILLFNLDEQKFINKCYTESLIDLQEIYIRLGEFNTAKEISIKYEKVLRIRNNNDPLTYSKFLINQGFLNLEIFKYVEAFDFFTQALAIHTDDTSKQSKKRIANDFNNIGEVFRRIQEYDKASIYYKKAISYLYSSGDTTDITVVGLLHNLSLCYISTNKIDSSLICEYEAIHFYEKFELEKKPQDFVQSLLNITDLNLNKKDTGTALFYFKKLIKSSKYLSKEGLVTYWDISSKIYDSHNNYANAIVCQRNSTYQKKINLLEYCKFSNTILSSLKEEYSSTININYLDLLIKKNPISVDTNYLLAHIYNYEILKKALNLKYVLSFSNYFRQSENNEQYRIYQEIIYRKDKLNALSYLQDSISVNIKKQLDYEIDSIEELLLKKSDFYLDLTRKFNINRKDIQSNLPSGAIAIEFLFDNENYAALVLKPNNEQPCFIPLFEQKQLDAVLYKSSSSTSSIDSLYNYSLNGKNLYYLIWKPLDSLLKNASTIYVAPTGSLHNINLAAIPINDSTIISSKYKLHLLTTTAEVVDKKEYYINSSEVKNAWIFGGIDYNKAKDENTPTQYVSNNLKKQFTENITRSYNKKWSYLSGTLAEASMVDSICKHNKINSYFVSGAEATTAKFKAIAEDTLKNNIVHIATHGFFFPPIESDSIQPKNDINISKFELLKKSNEPLLRSGLILAGANTIWGKPSLETDSFNQGLLTAYEISNLDLSKTKLVVLSACETGLGEIKGSEGVFGLQRAFKIAGVNNIIMSLWKIPDAQTKELMTLFYTNCFKGLTINESLRQAQFVMSKKYSPYYWAAFKLLE